MAKAKAQLKVIYHEFFCDDVLSEFDGFFEIVNGKVEYVTGWFANDANWRGEYMGGLIEHFGGDVQSLPEKHYKAARTLAAKAYGIDEQEDHDGEYEYVQLYYRKGTSDKVYYINLSRDDNGWFVNVEYGRRNGTLKDEMKCEATHYTEAKGIYDSILNEKLKKGYKRK
jgi:hypothetical protein